MTPNVSVLLQKWGVADVIGDNLVQIEELNMRRKDGTLVGHTEIPIVERALGRPWWLVHRAHLHQGLAAVATRLGATIHINSRVISLDYQEKGEVTVETQKGDKYHRRNGFNERPESDAQSFRGGGRVGNGEECDRLQVQVMAREAKLSLQELHPPLAKM